MPGDSEPDAGGRSARGFTEERADGGERVRRETFRRDESGGGESLEIQHSANLPEISLPLSAVEQAVGILVDNALEASPKGKQVRLWISAWNGQIIFEVSDQGAGMSAEVVRARGSRFSRPSRPARGWAWGYFWLDWWRKSWAERCDWSRSREEGRVRRWSFRRRLWRTGMERADEHHGCG